MQRILFSFLCFPLLLPSFSMTFRCALHIAMRLLRCVPAVTVARSCRSPAFTGAGCLSSSSFTTIRGMQRPSNLYIVILFESKRPGALPGRVKRASVRFAVSDRYRITASLKQFSLPHNCSVEKNGDEGIRTPDLRRAKAALSQLSYIPGIAGPVGLSGLEPETSPLSEARSNQLS